VINVLLVQFWMVITILKSSIFSRFSKVVSDNFLDFRGVCCYLPFSISDFADLGFFSPPFSQVCQGSLNLTYFFKEPAFYFIDSIFLFVSTSLTSALIFIISLLFLCKFSV
jgi:hypothetical protein